jgi:plasmid maintenance system antidote protein VapI
MSKPVTATQIRYKNYLDLLARCETEWGIRKGILARISREAAARGISLDPVYLSHLRNQVRDMGDDTARKLEEYFGLSTGWMDSLHDESQPADQGEAMFVETMLELYRRAPDKARALLRELLKTV